MFGINIYAIYAAVIIALFCGGFVNGCSYQQSKQEKVIRDKEHQYQADADQIRKDKDAQIRDINSKLVDAVSELRKRPGRSTEAVNGQGCNGTRLYAEDSEFLIREAARADEIRVALEACYKQYDSIK
jgi:hydroxylamine reductase (hybrid-cluster protein)